MLVTTMTHWQSLVLWVLSDLDWKHCDTNIWHSWGSHGTRMGYSLVWSKNYPLKDLPHTLDIYRRILNLENPPTDICLQDIVYWSNIQLHGNGLAKGLPASNKILTWKGMKWGHFLCNYVPDQTTSPPARAYADWLQACQTWPTATLHHQPSQWSPVVYIVFYHLCTPDLVCAPL